MLIFRNVKIGDMYTSAKEYLDFENGEEYIKSHMLKNSEWGAVAYLSESEYGRNRNKIEINDENYITAMGDMIKNQKQSSTGNLTGIYDLVGGAWEYVAVYYLNGENLDNGSPFTTKKESDEYSTVYNMEDCSLAYKPGDATFETLRWYGEAGNFFSSETPFLNRGGVFVNGSYAGIFSQGPASGSGGIALRMCLAIK